MLTMALKHMQLYLRVWSLKGNIYDEFLIFWNGICIRADWTPDHELWLDSVCKSLVKCKCKYLLY